MVLHRVRRSVSHRYSKNYIHGRTIDDRFKISETIFDGVGASTFIRRFFRFKPLGVHSGDVSSLADVQAQFDERKAPVRLNRLERVDTLGLGLMQRCDGVLGAPYEFFFCVSSQSA